MLYFLDLWKFGRPNTGLTLFYKGTLGVTRPTYVQCTVDLRPTYIQSTYVLYTQLALCLHKRRRCACSSVELNASGLLWLRLVPFGKLCVCLSNLRNLRNSRWLFIWKCRLGNAVCREIVCKWCQSFWKDPHLFYITRVFEQSSNLHFIDEVQWNPLWYVHWSYCTKVLMSEHKM